VFSSPDWCFYAAADLKKEKKLSGGASSTGPDLVFPLFKQNPHRWVKAKIKQKAATRRNVAAFARKL
jgi:hypothetical protein